MIFSRQSKEETRKNSTTALSGHDPHASTWDEGTKKIGVSWFNRVLILRVQALVQNSRNSTNRCIGKRVLRFNSQPLWKISESRRKNTRGPFRYCYLMCMVNLTRIIVVCSWERLKERVHRRMDLVCIQSEQSYQLFWAYVKNCSCYSISASRVVPILR